MIIVSDVFTCTYSLDLANTDLRRSRATFCRFRFPLFVNLTSSKAHHMILVSAISSFFFFNKRNVDNSSYSRHCHSNPDPGVVSLSGERGELVCGYCGLVKRDPTYSVIKIC